MPERHENTILVVKRLFRCEYRDTCHIYSISSSFTLLPETSACQAWPIFVAEISALSQSQVVIYETNQSAREYFQKHFLFSSLGLSDDTNIKGYDDTNPHVNAL